MEQSTRGMIEAVSKVEDMNFKFVDQVRLCNITVEKTVVTIVPTMNRSTLRGQMILTSTRETTEEESSAFTYFWARLHLRGEQEQRVDTLHHEDCTILAPAVLGRSEGTKNLGPAMTSTEAFIRQPPSLQHTNLQCRHGKEEETDMSASCMKRQSFLRGTASVIPRRR
eukprot:3937004-Rhodomonas_salina.1